MQNQDYPWYNLIPIFHQILVQKDYTKYRENLEMIINLIENVNFEDFELFLQVFKTKFNVDDIPCTTNVASILKEKQLKKDRLIVLIILLYDPNLSNKFINQYQEDTHGNSADITNLFDAIAEMTEKLPKEDFYLRSLDYNSEFSHIWLDKIITFISSLFDLPDSEYMQWFHMNPQLICRIIDGTMGICQDFEINSYNILIKAFIDNYVDCLKQDVKELLLKLHSINDLATAANSITLLMNRLDQYLNEEQGGVITAYISIEKDSILLVCNRIISCQEFGTISSLSNEDLYSMYNFLIQFETTPEVLELQDNLYGDVYERIRCDQGDPATFLMLDILIKHFISHNDMGKVEKLLSQKEELQRYRRMAISRRNFYSYTDLIRPMDTGQTSNLILSTFNKINQKEEEIIKKYECLENWLRENVPKGRPNAGKPSIFCDDI